MTDFVLECELRVSVRISASTAAEARQLVDNLFAQHAANFGALPDGEPIIAEVTCTGRGIVEIDGERMEPRAAREWERANG